MSPGGWPEPFPLQEKIPIPFGKSDFRGVLKMRRPFFRTVFSVAENALSALSGFQFYFRAPQGRAGGYHELVQISRVLRVVKI